MLISDFRDAVEQLGRFATIRDKAPEPTDRIFVRVAQGTVTLVAGDDAQTVRIQHVEPGAPEGKALVSARLLLTAGKALRGKGEVGFKFDGKGGATMVTSTGGKVVLPSVGTSLPNWVRPTTMPADLVANAEAGFWPAFAKLVEVEGDLRQGTGKAVAMRVEGERLRLTWGHQYIYVSTTLPMVEGITPWLAGECGGLPLDFIKSLRGIDAASQMEVTTGPTTVGAPTLIALTWPVATPTFLINEPDITTHVTADRKALLGAVKALPISDEHKRVTLWVEKGVVRVQDYTTPSSVEVTATTVGRVPANITLVATRLSKLLAALPGDEVYIGLDADNDAPVAFMQEGQSWRVFLAPVRR